MASYREIRKMALDIEREKNKSWKCEVIADSSETWAGNGLRFPTRIEAENYATDLGFRWTAVKHARVSQCDEPANYTFMDYKLEKLA